LEGESQPSGIIQLYRELLQIQSKAKSGIVVTKPKLAGDLVRDRLHQGIPLLLPSDFSPDWHQVPEVLEQVALWLAKDPSSSPEEGEKLKNISRNLPLLKRAVITWYRGRSLKALAKKQGVDDVLLASAIRATLKPFLSAYSKLLMPAVDQEIWRRNYCPICGGKPDFAYLDRERGARFLLCSQCDAEWLFLRLQCPYCGNQNQDGLAYFTDEEESYLYRLYVCEQCHTYIKAIDLRRTEAEVLLPLERVMTLDMDRQAQEKGYKPGWAI